MDMDEDQKHAYETIISGYNLLLAGNAGTGKTFIIKSAAKCLREKEKRPQYLRQVGRYLLKCELDSKWTLSGN